jgi:hypothetical protein
MPNTKSDSPYIFSTDEQLRQDLKKAMVDRGFSFNALASCLRISPSTLTRFLRPEGSHLHAATRRLIVAWLNSKPIPEKSELSRPTKQDEPALRALRAWTLTQDHLFADKAKLSPEVKNAVRTLNSYFFDKAME